MLVTGGAVHAADQPSLSPYHLVISYSPGGVTSIPYPSSERCERGRRALEIDVQRRIEKRNKNSPPGAVVVGTPYHLQGVCIPG